MFSGILQVTHMTSSSMSTRLAVGAAAGAAPGDEQGGEEREQCEARGPSLRLRERTVEERLVDLAAEEVDDPALAVDDERLGHVVRAVALGELRADVADVRKLVA